MSDFEFQFTRRQLLDLGAVDLTGCEHFMALYKDGKEIVYKPFNINEADKDQCRYFWKQTNKSQL